MQLQTPVAPQSWSVMHSVPASLAAAEPSRGEASWAAEASSAFEEQAAALARCIVGRVTAHAGRDESGDESAFDASAPAPDTLPVSEVPPARNDE